MIKCAHATYWKLLCAMDAAGAPDDKESVQLALAVAAMMVKGYDAATGIF